MGVLLSKNNQEIALDPQPIEFEFKPLITLKTELLHNLGIKLLRDEEHLSSLNQYRDRTHFYESFVTYRFMFSFRQLIEKYNLWEEYKEKLQKQLAIEH